MIHRLLLWMHTVELVLLRYLPRLLPKTTGQ